MNLYDSRVFREPIKVLHIRFDRLGGEPVESSKGED